jgi:hypothetical protein
MFSLIKFSEFVKDNNLGISDIQLKKNKIIGYRGKRAPYSSSNASLDPLAPYIHFRE